MYAVKVKGHDDWYIAESGVLNYVMVEGIDKAKQFLFAGDATITFLEAGLTYPDQVFEIVKVG